MSSSRRLQGLELLGLVGAPVPHWQPVKDHSYLERLSLQDTEFGWTIRTCLDDGSRETGLGLFYLNHADVAEVVRVLKERFARSNPHEFYIVYPSWDFRFSCNIVLSANVYIIEGKYGSQKSLAAGKAAPDFGLRVPFGMRNQMTCYIGHPTHEVLSWLGRILFWCMRIPKSTFYAEVALTHVPALMFYELFAD